VDAEPEGRERNAGLERRDANYAGADQDLTKRGIYLDSREFGSARKSRAEDRLDRE